MSKQPAIIVDNVSMKFNLSKEKVDSLKDYIIKSIKKEIKYNEFWALKDVSFKLEKGDRLGILGLNGAGKSTLVRCLNYLAAFSLVLVQQRVKKGDSNAQQSCRHAEKHEFRVPYRAEVSR